MMRASGTPVTCTGSSEEGSAPLTNVKSAGARVAREVNVSTAQVTASTATARRIPDRAPPRALIGRRIAAWNGAKNAETMLFAPLVGSEGSKTGVEIVRPIKSFAEHDRGRITS